jgi:hypothetical protein
MLLKLPRETWGARGVLRPDFGWFPNLKSVSDLCQSTNWKRTCEIESVRAISCGIGKESSFWQRRTDGLNAFLAMPRTQLNAVTLGRNHVRFSV